MQQRTPINCAARPATTIQSTPSSRDLTSESLQHYCGYQHQQSSTVQQQWRCERSTSTRRRSSMYETHRLHPLLSASTVISFIHCSKVAAAACAFLPLLPALAARFCSSILLVSCKSHLPVVESCKSQERNILSVLLFHAFLVLRSSSSGHYVSSSVASCTWRC